MVGSAMKLASILHLFAYRLHRKVDEKDNLLVQRR